VAVLGAGVGGYPAAIRAAQLGASVCIVENDAVGGTCLNRGCIPTKVLHAKAHLVHSLHVSEQAGIVANEVAIDPAVLFSFKNNVVSDLVRGVETLFKRWKVKVVRGTGRLVSPRNIEVEGYGTIETEKIIVATGSEETEIPGVVVDGDRVLDSAQLLSLGSIPRSLVIIGGGVIGCEFASIFNAFGTEVKIVEMLPRLVATEDLQISRALQTYFKRKGIELHLKSRVVSVEKFDGGVNVVLDSEDKITGEFVLVAAGRKPRVSGLGLEEIGVEFGPRGIVVDDWMSTNVAGVYAAGDVVGGWLLAHVAMRESVVAVENAFGAYRKIDYSSVPTTIYTIPEISRVGMTEEQAAAEGIEVKKGRFPFAANGKAKGLQETDGFVKWIARRDDDRVIGLHIIGPGATELVASGIIAVERRMTVEQFVNSIFPHPTLSESLFESAESILGKAIHIK